MFMARPQSENDIPKGSLTSQTQQLPSFSHFLSGVQQPESSVQQNTFSHQEESHTFRRDLFNSCDGYSQTQIEPEILPPRPPTSAKQQQLQQPQQHHDGRHIQVTYSSTQADQYTANQKIGSNPHRAQHERYLSTEYLPIALAQGESSQAKTVVREANIEGKGLCYVYEDGSVCPKAVNGDTVNPKWGTTKAGKPRKRLGQACNTCREKKIRCDPQLPKCAQCQKFGRECRFETGSRGSQRGDSSSARASPTTPELRKDSGHDRHGSSVSADTPSEQLCSRENSRSSMNLESLLSPASTVLSEEAPPPKKRKVSGSSKTESLASQPLRRPATPERMTMIDGDLEQRPQFSANTNPLDVDKRLTLHYAHQYIENINSKLYHILPTSKFLDWVENGCGKSHSDLAVVYAMMAFSTTYSGKDDSGWEVQARTFTSIAEDVLKRHLARPDFQCVLGQLLLSFQALSAGDFVKAEQLTASTLRTCYELGFHQENSLDQLLFQGMACLGFDKMTAKECMRRTFWLTYMGNCFQKYCVDARRGDNAFRCTLRLPCDDSSYDNGLVPALPVYHCDKTGRQDFPADPRHGTLAYLAEIAFLLDEVTEMQRSTTSTNRQAYVTFYNTMKDRLSAWEKKVRKYVSELQQRETPTGDTGLARPGSGAEHPHISASGLHFLYHFVAMALHRHVAWQHLGADIIERCSKESYSQAVRTLELVHRLDEDGGATLPFSRMARTCPIASLAVFAAVDVITAAGTISEVFEHQHEGREQNFKEMISCAIQTLEQQSRHWRTAERQSKLVQNRLKHILSLSQPSTKRVSKGFYFRKPLYSPFSLERDIVYGPSRLEYLRALGLGHILRKESEMMELGVQSPE